MDTASVHSKQVLNTVVLAVCRGLAVSTFRHTCSTNALQCIL